MGQQSGHRRDTVRIASSLASSFTCSSPVPRIDIMPHLEVSPSAETLVGMPVLVVKCRAAGGRKPQGREGLVNAWRIGLGELIRTRVARLVRHFPLQLQLTSRHNQTTSLRQLDSAGDSTLYPHHDATLSLHSPSAPRTELRARSASDPRDRRPGHLTSAPLPLQHRTSDGRANSIFSTRVVLRPPCRASLKTAQMRKSRRRQSIPC